MESEAESEKLLLRLTNDTAVVDVAMPKIRSAADHGALTSTNSNNIQLMTEIAFCQWFKSAFVGLFRANSNLFVLIKFTSLFKHPRIGINPDRQRLGFPDY